LIVLFSVLY